MASVLCFVTPAEHTIPNIANGELTGLACVRQQTYANCNLKHHYSTVRQNSFCNAATRASSQGPQQQSCNAALSRYFLTADTHHIEWYASAVVILPGCAK